MGPGKSKSMLIADEEVMKCRLIILNVQPSAKRWSWDKSVKRTNGIGVPNVVHISLRIHSRPSTGRFLRHVVRDVRFQAVPVRSTTEAMMSCLGIKAALEWNSQRIAVSCS